MVSGLGDAAVGGVAYYKTFAAQVTPIRHADPSYTHARTCPSHPPIDLYRPISPAKFAGSAAFRAALSGGVAHAAQAIPNTRHATIALAGDADARASQYHFAHNRRTHPDTGKIGIKSPYVLYSYHARCRISTSCDDLGGLCSSMPSFPATYSRKIALEIISRR
ncbi:MAG: hypothetical protein HZB57_10620 [Gammaproteobacteria bacterium]|nr:hypothetical protein [Gammaproteobacteria bacterium]